MLITIQDKNVTSQKISSQTIIKKQNEQKCKSYNQNHIQNTVKQKKNLYIWASYTLNDNLLPLLLSTNLLVTSHQISKRQTQQTRSKKQNNQPARNKKGKKEKKKTLIAIINHSTKRKKALLR